MNGTVTGPHGPNAVVVSPITPCSPFQLPVPEAVHSALDRPGLLELAVIEARYAQAVTQALAEAYRGIEAIVTRTQRTEQGGAR